MLARPLSDIVKSAGKDIGKTPPADDPQVLPMSNLTTFISKCENAIETELETLRAFIVENTTSKAKTLELGHFFDHVINWAERVWKQRVGEEDESEENEDEVKLDATISLVEERISENKEAVNKYLNSIKEKNSEQVDVNKNAKGAIKKFEELLNLSFNMNTTKEVMKSSDAKAL